MALDFIIERSRQAVDTAIMQFAARRSYRLTQPWYLDGIRIEATQTQTPSVPSGNLSDKMAGIWTALTEGDAKCPRIDIEVRDKRTRTKLKISVSDHPESVKLAYELHVYLMDDRAFSDQCPARCPKCGSPVPNVVARYCGRCGSQLTGNSLDAVPPLLPFQTDSLMTNDEVEPSEKICTTSKVAIERDSEPLLQDTEDASADQQAHVVPEPEIDPTNVDQQQTQKKSNGAYVESQEISTDNDQTLDKTEATEKNADPTTKTNNRTDSPQKRRMLAED